MTANRVDPVGEVFFALCKSVDTGVSLGRWLRYKWGEHLQLASAAIDPADYVSPTVFARDYLVDSYMSKYTGLNTGLNLEAEALKKLEASEVQCALTNGWIQSCRATGFDTRTERILFAARRKIARLLGPFSWERIARYGWGPGATFELARKRAQVDLKMSELPFTVTRRALPLFREELAADLHWSACVLGVSPADIGGKFCFLPSLFDVVEGCRVTTVPKNAKTDRVIAIEPRANGFLQKGLGYEIRRCLRKVGVDLDDQGLNQSGAYRAWFDDLATLDLKAASDTVSKELVFELLPVDWAIALDDVRSHSFCVNGQWIKTEKFSSMGNGFTFELESLIFWSLASACVEDSSDRYTVLVYGDDIIVPKESAELLVEVLQETGFEINLEKTYLSGNFYESCGRHYFKGEDVTPIYQKEECTDEDDLSFIRCGNRIMRYAVRRGDYPYSLERVCKSPWYAIRARAGHTHRFQLPLGTEGDDGWLVPADEFEVGGRDVNLGLSCRTLRIVSAQAPANPAALLALRLRLRETGACGEDLSWYDMIDVHRTETRASRRWVMPTGEFGLTW